MAASVSVVGRGIGWGWVHEDFEVSVSPKRLLPSFFYKAERTGPGEKDETRPGVAYLGLKRR